MTELIFFYYLPLVLAAVLIIAAWALVCNEATYSHRSQVIRDMMKDPYIYFRYKAVPYNKHMLRLMLGNWNWKALYYESK